MLIGLFLIAVIFSRIDPGGKLVMGFRKASNSSDPQVKLYRPSIFSVYISGVPSCEGTLLSYNGVLMKQAGQPSIHSP